MHWDPRDVEAITEIQRTGYHRTLEAAIQSALWIYARHLGLDLPSDVFRERKPPRGFYT